MIDRKLEKELRSLGVNANESEQLSRLAGDLRKSNLPKLSKETKSQISRIPGKRWQLHIYHFAAGGAAAMFIGLVFLSQSALPGSWLYGIKRGSEQLRTIVQPGYSETLIDKRADEIDQLIETEAEPAQLEQAKQEYEKAIETYVQQNNDEPSRQEKSDSSRRQQGKDRRDVREWWENRNRDNRKNIPRLRLRDR